MVSRKLLLIVLMAAVVASSTIPATAQEEVKITIVYNQGNEVRKTAALLLADNLKQLGIKNVEVLELDWPTLLKGLRNGEYNVFFLGWAPDYGDPDDYIYPLFYSKAANNWVHYKNPEVDELIMKARKTLDDAERQKLYEEAAMKMYEDAPWVPLYQPKAILTYRTWLKGVYYNPIWGESQIRYYDLWKTSDANQPDTFVYATYGEPESLDPAFAYDSASWGVISQIYETLLTYKPESSKEVVPLLAESYTVSDDGLVWTFKLRKGVTFHNGNPLTADDVVYSIERVIKMNQDPAWMIADFVDKVEKVDDYTVKIYLKEPYAGFKFVLATPVAAIVDKETVEEHGGVVEGQANEWMTKNAVGTGPYKLVEWKQGELIHLEAYDNYWKGWDGNHVKTVIIRNVPEWETRKLMLLKGDADMVTTDTLHVKEVQGQEGVEVVFGDSLVIQYIGLVNDLPPFDDVHVRKVFTYAFPYDDFIEQALYGYAIRLRGPIPKGLLGYSDNVPLYEFDLKKAEEHLKKSKYYEALTGKTEAKPEKTPEKTATPEATPEVKEEKKTTPGFGALAAVAGVVAVVYLLRRRK
jgi:PGF-CTERM protein